MYNSKEIEKLIIAKCVIKNKTFVITADKKIFEKTVDGKYIECDKNDVDIDILKKYIEPPKGLDINY